MGCENDEDGCESFGDDNDGALYLPSLTADGVPALILTGVIGPGSG